MPIHDFISVVTWWAVLLSIGAIFFPTTAFLFKKFFDRGYIFSKILGIGVASYVALVLGTLHIASFSQTTLFFILVACALLQLFLLAKQKKSPRKKLLDIFLSPTMAIVCIEELLFFTSLLFWSYVRAHQPDIHGLEKYMDFGFVNSILRSDYFPPKDMWLTPQPINYYYFGHLVTGVLTKLSGISSSVSFNLMLATLFGFTLTAGFSLGGNLWTQLLTSLKKGKRLLISFLIAGILSGSIISSSGNLHTLYSFFTPYQNDHPVPLWQLKFAPNTFPNAYWYPNATRYIYHTIHEFPLYSFVVSDLHGHVVDIPFVLLTLAILFSLFLYTKEEIISTVSKNSSLWSRISHYITFLPFWGLLSFCLTIMYMTNALDGLIYMLLTFLCIFFLYKNIYQKRLIATIFQTPLTSVFVIILGGFILFSLPFSLFFKSFVNQIGIVCPPSFLVKLQTLGLFVFEPNHCDHSPWWQLLILYGFFAFWVGLLWILLLRTKRTIVDTYIFIVTGVALLLIILPEFFYLRDIYTTFYRANTMFKLVYQAFLMLSLVSVYAIARILSLYVSQNNIFKKIGLGWVILIGLMLLVLVSIYPYFAIGSYYDNLKTYYGLDGTTYLSRLYPDDYRAILWINSHISSQPIMLEAPGDSYTDYERISANTGLPTVLGWSVHEWLWHGTYDIVPPRANDVQIIYETRDIETTKTLLHKYHISYIYIGELERQKYGHLSEDKFKILGQVVFRSGVTTIYQLSF